MNPHFNLEPIGTGNRPSRSLFNAWEVVAFVLALA